MPRPSLIHILRELEYKTKQKIKFGAPKEEIVKALMPSFGEDLGADSVKEEIGRIVDSYGDYDLIQQIMRSKIVRDIRGRDYLILDPKKRVAKQIIKESLKEVLHPKLDISDRIYTCHFSYNPYLLQQLYKDDTGSWVYNQYVPPSWQKDLFYEGTPIEALAEIPEMYRRFLIHLVEGDEASYEYILNWLATALRARNYCILTTIGAGGIGKGRLGDIMKLLFGKENFSETGKRILASQFNSQIKNKRLVYCDEASVKDQTQEERLKTLVNNAVEVEQKGKDAELIDNYANFYFSSNYLDSIKLYKDDRRFSIVNLTDTQLKKVMTEEEINSLTLQENVDLLARYLYFREVAKSFKLDVFISKRSEEIREAGLTIWQDWFLDSYAIDNAGKIITIDEVSAAIEDKYGSRIRPGKRAFMELEKYYPSKLKVYKPIIKDKQIWAIKFPEREAVQTEK